MTGRRRDDAGFTLTDVMVSMAVMSVVMVVFTTAILQVYRTGAKTESISMAQSQLQIAFQRFDRELRYASWIAAPGQVGNVWYVEYANFDGTRCGQLRLESPAPSDQDSAANGYGILQLLAWARAAPPAEATRQTIASQLLPPDSNGPFERQAAGVSVGASSGVGSDFTPDFQRLRIRVTARTGDSTAQVDTTFTALNTSRNTAAKNECEKGRPSS